MRYLDYWDPMEPGRSLPLRCISTLIKSTSGNVYIDRYNVLENEKAIRSRIGFMTSDMKLDGFFTPDYMVSYFIPQRITPSTLITKLAKL